MSLTDYLAARKTKSIHDYSVNHSSTGNAVSGLKLTSSATPPKSDNLKNAQNSSMMVNVTNAAIVGSAHPSTSSNMSNNYLSVPICNQNTPGLVAHYNVKKTEYTYAHFSEFQSSESIKKINPETSSTILSKPKNRLLLKEEGIFVQPRPDMMRPHKSEIAREGYLWIMKGSTWQRWYSVVTYDLGKLVMQLYHDDMANRPTRVFDLHMNAKAQVQSAQGYRPIHEFKLSIGATEMTFGCDSAIESQAWVTLINMMVKTKCNSGSLPHSSSTLADIHEDEELDEEENTQQLQSSELENFSDNKISKNRNNQETDVKRRKRNKAKDSKDILFEIQDSMEEKYIKITETMETLVDQSQDNSNQFKDQLTKISKDIVSLHEFSVNNSRSQQDSLLKSIDQLLTSPMSKWNYQLEEIQQEMKKFLSQSLDAQQEKQQKDLKVNLNEALQPLKDDVKEYLKEVTQETMAVAGKLDGIVDVVEFVNASQCKIVDLLTDSLKSGPLSTATAKEDEKRLKLIQEQLRIIAREQEQNDDNLHDTLEQLMKGVEKVGQQVEEQNESKDEFTSLIRLGLDDRNSNVLQVIRHVDERSEKHDEFFIASLLSIQKSIQNIQNSLSLSSSDPKLVDAIEDLTSRISLMNQRQSLHVPNSPDRPTTSLLMNVNEKLLSLSTLMETSRESSNSRMNSIEEKLRNILVQQTAQQNTLAMDSSERQNLFLNELKATLNQLENKVNKSRSEFKSNHDVLQSWMTRLNDTIKNNQRLDKFESVVGREAVLQEKLDKLIQLAESQTYYSTASSHNSSYLRSSSSCSSLQTKTQEETNNKIIDSLNQIHSLLAENEKSNAHYAKPIVNTINTMEPVFIKQTANDKQDIIVRLDKVDKSLASIQHGLLSLCMPSHQDMFKTSSTESKLEEILQFLEGMRNTLQTPMNGTDRPNGRQYDLINNNGADLESIARQLMTYQQDLTNREMAISQALDSMQHTLARLMDCVYDGQDVIISKSNGHVLKKAPSSSSSLNRVPLNGSRAMSVSNASSGTSSSSGYTTFNNTKGKILDITEMEEMKSLLKAIHEKVVVTQPEHPSNSLETNPAADKTRKVNLLKEVEMLEKRKIELENQVKTLERQCSLSNNDNANTAMNVQSVNNTVSNNTRRPLPQIPIVEKPVSFDIERELEEMIRQNNE